MHGLFTLRPWTMEFKGRTSSYDSLKEHKLRDSQGLSTWLQMLQDTWVKLNSYNFFLLLVPEKNKVTHHPSCLCSRYLSYLCDSSNEENQAASVHVRLILHLPPFKKSNQGKTV